MSFYLKILVIFTGLFLVVFMNINAESKKKKSSKFYLAKLNPNLIETTLQIKNITISKNDTFFYFFLKKNMLSQKVEKDFLLRKRK